MSDRLFSTYLVASRSRVLYVGVTGDLRRRMVEHREGKKKGFTARYGCDRLVWVEVHADSGVAIAREKELKGWTRARKIALIEDGNPTWVDLSLEMFGWG